MIVGGGFVLFVNSVGLIWFKALYWLFIILAYFVLVCWLLWCCVDCSICLFVVLGIAYGWLSSYWFGYYCRMWCFNVCNCCLFALCCLMFFDCFGLWNSYCNSVVWYYCVLAVCVVMNCLFCFFWVIWFRLLFGVVCCFYFLVLDVCGGLLWITVCC